MELELSDLRGGYVQLLESVLVAGQHVTSRGFNCCELTGVRLIFTDPLAPLLPINVGRRVNTRLAAVEALQIIAGQFDASLVLRASPAFSSVLVNPGAPDYGAYGPRLGYAIGSCVSLLEADPGSRQAVALIWRPEDLDQVGDKPCTVFLQFLLRNAPTSDGELTLELYSYMRSQDAWLGVPYDIFMFSQLQHTVARELKVPAGRLIHHATSMHLYDHHVAEAQRVVSGYRAGDFPEQLNDLPLGVCALADTETGFDAAGVLLDHALQRSWMFGSSAPARAATLNPWYAARLAEIE